MIPVGSKSRKGKKSAAPSESRDFNSVMALVNRFTGMGQRYFRRLATATSLATNGSGVVPLSTLATTNAVNTYPDFSSLASLYTSYRVHALKLSFFPCYRVNTTAILPPVYVASCPFRGGLAPSTIGQIQESPDSKSFGGYDKAIVTVNFEGDNDAHLWTPTNAAVTASEAFGVVICGSSLTGTASTIFWYVYVEAVVEFMVTG